MSVLHYVLAYVLALNQVFAIYLETYQDANFTCKTIIKGVKLDNRKPLTGETINIALRFHIHAVPLVVI